MLYHVSEKPGLKVLRPHASSHGRAYVYAVDDLVTGLLFGAGHDDFDLYLSNDAAGVPTVRECWPGAFQKVYQGKRCSVYEVDEAGFQRGVTSWDPELVHEGEVAVERETVVDDLYRRLLEEEKRVTLTILRYEHTDEYRRVIAGHVVDRLIRFDVDLDTCMETDSRFAAHFRGLVQGLRDLMDGRLLP